MRFWELLEKHGVTGWLLFIVLVVIIVFQYGATWFRAFRETGNIAQANLLTSIKIQMDSMAAELKRKEEVIQSLLEQQRICKEDNDRMEGKIRELRSHIDALGKGQ